MTFARRAGASNDASGTCFQSTKAQLGWEIDDAAIVRVNGHFASLASLSSGLPDVRSGLLIVDELGRLELACGTGLTEAVRLLEAGPTDAFPHALIVVRKGLLSQLEGRFPLWGEMVDISSDSEGILGVLLENFRKYLNQDCS